MTYLRSICGAPSSARDRSETSFAISRAAIATCVTLLGLAAALTARAADLSVVVLDREGRAVPQTVVTAARLNAASVPRAAPPATLDQRNLAFVPRTLVVGVGARVEFPNNDSVSHQVYSFSPAKRFQLPLYKGEVHPPVTFDRPGLVVLGCNIHDGMVGYIYVTDAPFFGETDDGGALHLGALPEGDYRITIWSPFIADAAVSLVHTVHLDKEASAAERFQLRAALRAQPEPRPRRRDWEY